MPPKKPRKKPTKEYVSKADMEAALKVATQKMEEAFVSKPGPSKQAGPAETLTTKSTEQVYKS